MARTRSPLPQDLDCRDVDSANHANPKPANKLLQSICGGVQHQQLQHTIPMAATIPVAKTTVDYRTPRVLRLYQNSIIGIAEVAAITTASSEDSQGISGLARRRCAQVLPMRKCGCARGTRCRSGSVHDRRCCCTTYRRAAPHIVSGRRSFQLTPHAPAIDSALRQTFHSTKARSSSSENTAKTANANSGCHRPSTSCRGISSSGRTYRQWHESRGKLHLLECRSCPAFILLLRS